MNSFDWWLKKKYIKNLKFLYENTIAINIFQCFIIMDH